MNQIAKSSIRNAAATMVLAVGVVSSAWAAPITGDFREELSLPSFSAGVRVLEKLSEPVAGAPDLSAADEIANPNVYSGSAAVNLDSGGLITLTGDQEGVGFANYELAVFKISNIVFDAGEIITGLSTLVDNLVDLGSSNTDGPFTVTTAFTSDSVTITYASDNGTDDFEFGDGFTSTFQIETSTVPEPITVLLMGIGLAGLGIARRRRH